MIILNDNPKNFVNRERKAGQSVESIVVIFIISILIMLATKWRQWFATETGFGILVTASFLLAIGFAVKHVFDTVNMIMDALIIKALSDGCSWNEADILNYVKSQRRVYRILTSTIAGRLYALVTNGEVKIVDRKYQLINKTRRIPLVDKPSVEVKVFISYRRTDTANMTGRLRDQLTLRYGSESVFMDVHSILGGSDFRHAIKSAMKQCTHMIIVVGGEWQIERLQKSNDPVRFEIEEALRLRLPIIPVLVESANFPKVEMLPKSVREIGYRTAVRVRLDPDFQMDLAKLTHSIENGCGFSKT